MQEIYWKICPSRATNRIHKADLIIMFIITAIYSVIALYQLGDFQIPSTYWESTNKEEKIDFDFSDKKESITELNFYIGRFEDKSCSLYESDDQIHWKKVMVRKENQASYIAPTKDFLMEGIYRWGKVTCNITKPYVRLVFHDKQTILHELVFRMKDGTKVIPGNQEKYKALFDEQELCKTVNGYETGTYFDETYYVRTAYEMIHGLDCYETTHPPLGKIILSIGIRIFGFSPFGWRIMGTLFGIAMLPILYLLAKKMFSKTWVATAATVLFAADFMHFTQTRIATIDVYVTFFILLMYLFMYQYTQMNFYDTPLKKTLLPLFGAGVSMGLACACKWSGVYAAGGLAILFFATVGRRALEYCYAKTCPNESSEGIIHRDIIKRFKRSMVITLGFCVLVFLFVPACIYLISYMPFRDGMDAGLVSRMLRNQYDMYHFHTTVDLHHNFSSWYFEWPTMTKPIWYFNKIISGTLQSNINAFGNPLVWWTGIPIFFYMLYLAIGKRDRTAMFLCLSYLVQFMPWAYVPRGTFIYHYFPSVPFVVLMIAYVMYRICKPKKRKKVKVACVLCITYVAATVGLFVLFYPLISGYPMDALFAERYLRWLDSWVLVRIPL